MCTSTRHHIESVHYYCYADSCFNQFIILLISVYGKNLVEMAGSDARGLLQVCQHENELYSQDGQHTEYFAALPHTEVSLIPRVFKFLTTYTTLVGT